MGMILLIKRVIKWQSCHTSQGTTKLGFYSVAQRVFFKKNHRGHTMIFASVI